MPTFDDFEFGKMMTRIDHLEDDVKALRAEVRSMDEKLTHAIAPLTAIAERSKGGLWVLILVGTVIGSLATIAVRFIGGH